MEERCKYLAVPLVHGERLMEIGRLTIFTSYPTDFGSRLIQGFVGKGKGKGLDFQFSTISVSTVSFP